MVYIHLPDYREEHTDPLDIVGLILFGSGVALAVVRAGSFRRAHSEHARDRRLARSCRLRCSPATACTQRVRRFPLLTTGALPHPHLPRVGERQFLHAARHRRRAVSAAAALPGGPGLYSPIQSGLLIMPQAVAAMSMKLTMPKILARFGYRDVLISNTADHRPAVDAVRDDRRRHAGVADRRCWPSVYGFFTSLQYTSMNTLVYADIERRAGQRRQLHRQHHAANVDQLRRRDLLRSPPRCSFRRAIPPRPSRWFTAFTKACSRWASSPYFRPWYLQD